MSRIARSVAAALILVLLLAAPVLAIAQPDIHQIYLVSAYRHILEANDQLYLIEYEVDYTVNPNVTITQAFLGILVGADNLTQIRAVAPYSYTATSYGRGLIGIYFTAAEAPTWNLAYKTWLAGNPTLTWTGGAGIPPIKSSSVDWWSPSTGISTTQTELAEAILQAAVRIADSWGVPALTTATTSGVKLNAAGEEYFTGVLPQLREMAPGVFSGISTAPESPQSRNYQQAYASNLSGNVTGTPFDFTNLANALGISRMFLSSTLYFIVVGTFAYFVVMHIGPKPLMALSVPLVIIGAVLGVLPLQLTIGLGALSVALTAFLLFYNKSSA